MTSTSEFVRRDLEDLFFKIGEQLARKGELVDITIYGGCALLLKGYRDYTKDVDATFDKWDEENLYQITSALADQKKLDKHWFNNDIEPFKSEKESLEFYKKYPDYSKNGLRIHLPKPDYMLALQVQALAMASPSDDPTKPLGKHALDVKKLSTSLGLNREETIKTVKIYFSETILTPVVLKWLELTIPQNEMEIPK